MKKKDTLGYSQKSLAMLGKGTYGKTTGRQAKYTTSQEQTRQAKELPMLNEMKKTTAPNKATQMVNNPVQNREQQKQTVSVNNIEQPKAEQKPDNYVVHRDRYDKLMQDSRLANDIKTLAEVNYNNANQDATVSQEWADTYGAKKITGGYTKQEYLDALSKRYNLTAKELNDMALTFHSDANKAETAQYGEGLKKAGEKLPVLGSLGSFIGTLGSGVEGLYNLAAGGITGDDRYLSNMFRTTKNAPREGVKNNIDSNVGKAVYDIGMGVGDMAAGALAGSAPAILAGNTANEAQASAIDRGSSVRKSSAYGTAAGAIDYITNTIGLDKAKKLAVDGIKSSGIKKILLQSGAAGLGEAGENLIQDIGQTFFDNLINGKNSELRTSYTDKVASGMSESDALKETAKEYAGQLAMSAGTGFAMGSAMQGGSTIAKNLPEIKSDLDQFKMDNRGSVDVDALFGKNPELQEIISRDPGSFSETELAEIKTKKKDVTAQLKAKNAEIRAQEEVLNNAPKKNKVAEKQKLDALNKEAQELQLVKKIYNHVGKGEAVPTKSLLMPNDYNNIFNEQTGTANAINVAVKFAGDTPQAKQLGREAKQLLTKYVNGGDINDYYEFLGKVGDLSSLAEAKKADYVTKGGTYRYDDIYGGTFTDKAGNEIDNTLYNAIDNGSIPEIVNNTRNKIYKNVGDVHKTLTSDNAPLTEVVNDGNNQGMNTSDISTTEFNGYKVGDKVTYSTNDFDGKSTSEGVIKEVYPDHMIVDVPGLSDHVWIDSDLSDMVRPSSAPISNVEQIKEGIKAKDFKPVTFVNNEGHTYIVTKSTRPGEKWQLSHIDDTGRPIGHSAYSNDADILADIDKINNNNIANVGGDTIFNQGQTTIGDMLNNPDDYTLDDFQRAVRSYDKNADIDGAEIEDIIAFLSAEADNDPDFLTTKIAVNRLVEKGTTSMDPAHEFPENGNEIPTVKPTEPTPARSLPELVQNNSIIQRMMAQGGGNGGNVPPAEADYSMGNRRHTKTSETYTNTGRYGKGWTEEEYNKYTDPSQFQYEDVSEQESVERAANMLQSEGIEGFKNRVMDKERLTGVEIDGLMMEWRILGEQARTMEAAGEDASDAWKESVKVFRKIQEQSTSNAQALQVLAKWSRNTPEGMLAEAENIINGKKKAKGPNKSDIQKEFEKFAKKNKKFKFSDEFAVEFQRKAAELEGLDRDSRRAKEIMADLGRMVNRQVPSSIGEKAMTFLMDNMLGNFRTLITRNAGGNLGLNAVEQIAERPLAALIDMGVSKKTGRRTQAGLSKEGLSEYVNGFTKGLKEEVSDFKKDLHTSRTGENTLSNAIGSNRHVFKEKGVMDRLDKLVRHGLSVGDRPFYEAVYKQTIGDYNRLRDQGLMGDVVQGLSDEDFNSYAETAAKLNALSAVYQQDSLMSKALLGFKGAVGDLSDAALGFDILSQFSMPFVKTPANVVERAIDYSPLGFIRNAVRTGKEIKADDFDQNRFANETARNILGTALMTGGAAYAANGGISGAYSEDKDEKQAQKEAGEQEYAWNVPNWIPALGGKQMDISWAPVVGSNVVAAAAAQDAYSKGEDGVAMNLVKGLEAGGQSLFDQSMFQGLQRLFGTGEAYNSDEGIVANMENVVKSGLSQLIPSLVRQSAQVKDPYQRDIAYSNKGLSFGPMDNYDINSLVNSIPELRENVLAPKVNTSGELMKENQGRNLGMKILEDMILPGKLTDVNYSRLSEEAKRLSNLTTTKNAYMPKADRQYVDTEDHVLNNQEWTEYQQKYYGQLTKAGEKLIDSELYKSADPDTQESMLSGVYSGLRSGINSEYNGKEVTGAAKKYVEAGGGDKGIDAVISYIQSKKALDDSGISSSSNAGKEIAQAYAEGDTKKAENLTEKYKKYNQERERLNEKYNVDMKMSDFTKREDAEPGSNEAWAKEHGSTTKVPEVKNTNPNVDVSQHKKYITRAGAQAQKYTNDIPKLDELNFSSSEKYTYAYAINQDKSLTPQKFGEQFDKLDMDNNGSMKQDEMINYFNKYKTSESQAQYLWNTYGENKGKAWTAKPVYKDGKWKKSK